MEDHRTQDAADSVIKGNLQPSLQASISIPPVSSAPSNHSNFHSITSNESSPPQLIPIGPLSSTSIERGPNRRTQPNHVNPADHRTKLDSFEISSSSSVPISKSPIFHNSTSQLPQPRLPPISSLFDSNSSAVGKEKFSFGGRSPGPIREDLQSNSTSERMAILNMGIRDQSTVQEDFDAWKQRREGATSQIPSTSYFSAPTLSSPATSSTSNSMGAYNRYPDNRLGEELMGLPYSMAMPASTQFRSNEEGSWRDQPSSNPASFNRNSHSRAGSEKSSSDSVSIHGREDDLHSASKVRSQLRAVPADQARSKTSSDEERSHSSGHFTGPSNSEWQADVVGRKGRVQSVRKKKRKNEADQLCLGCGATDTPEWRKGPTGARSLCNRCGLQWIKMCRRNKETTKKTTPTDEAAEVEIEEEVESDLVIHEGMTEAQKKSLRELKELRKELKRNAALKNRRQVPIGPDTRVIVQSRQYPPSSSYSSSIQGNSIQRTPSSGFQHSSTSPASPTFNPPPRNATMSISSLVASNPSSPSSSSSIRSPLQHTRSDLPPLHSSRVYLSPPPTFRSEVEQFDPSAQVYRAQPSSSSDWHRDSTEREAGLYRSISQSRLNIPESTHFRHHQQTSNSDFNAGRFQQEPQRWNHQPLRPSLPTPNPSRAFLRDSTSNGHQNNRHSRGPSL